MESLTAPNRKKKDDELTQPSVAVKPVEPQGLALSTADFDMAARPAQPDPEEWTVPEQVALRQNRPDLADAPPSDFTKGRPIGDAGFLGGVAEFGKRLVSGVPEVANQMSKMVRFHGNDEPGEENLIADGLESIATKASEYAPFMQESITSMDRGRKDDWQSMVRKGAGDAGHNIAPSVLPPLIGGLAGGVPGGVAGLGFTLNNFYGSAAYEMQKEVLASGASKEDARTAGHLAGSIEAGGELLSDVMFFGLAKAGSGVSKQFIKQGKDHVVKAFLDGKSAKQIILGIAGASVGNTVTELGQEAGQLEVSKRYTGKEWGGKDLAPVIVPSLIMGLFLSSGSAYIGKRQTSEINRILGDPKASKEERQKASAVVAQHLQKGGDKELATAWNKFAYANIELGKPVVSAPDEIFLDHWQNVVERTQEKIASGDEVPLAPMSTTEQAEPEVPLGPVQKAMVNAGIDPTQETPLDQTAEQNIAADVADTNTGLVGDNGVITQDMGNVGDNGVITQIDDDAEIAAFAEQAEAELEPSQFEGLPEEELDQAIQEIIIELADMETYQDPTYEQSLRDQYQELVRAKRGEIQVPKMVLNKVGLLTGEEEKAENKTESLKVNQVIADGKNATKRRTKLSTPDGKLSIEADYELVDASSLITSHNDAGAVNGKFPSELQPRGRERKSSQLQITEIANNLMPEKLFESVETDRGAPIVADDNLVESGNGRVLAINKAYAEGKADKYRQALAERAESLGLDPSQLEGLERPVLVRRRTSKLDDKQRLEFTATSNRDDKLPSAPSEQATADAKLLSDEDLQLLTVPADNNYLATANGNFLRKFAERLGNEAKGLIDENGNWSQAMDARVRQAVFAKAFGNKKLTELATEATGDSVKLVHGLGNIAADVAGIREHDLGLIKALADAALMVREAKSRSLSVQDMVSQTDMFNKASAEVEALALGLDANYNSVASISKYLKSVVKQVSAENEKNTSDLLGENPTGALTDLLRVNELQPKAQEAKAEPARVKAKTSKKALVGEVETFDHVVEKHKVSGITKAGWKIELSKTSENDYVYSVNHDSTNGGAGYGLHGTNKSFPTREKAIEAAFIETVEVLDKQLGWNTRADNKTDIKQYTKMLAEAKKQQAEHAKPPAKAEEPFMNLVGELMIDIKKAIKTNQGTYDGVIASVALPQKLNDDAAILRKSEYNLFDQVLLKQALEHSKRNDIFSQVQRFLEAEQKDESAKARIAKELSLYGEDISKDKPTLILPCCEGKKLGKHKAYESYNSTTKGAGYMGIMRTFNDADVLNTFNVFFLSAEHGLIPAGKYIVPYERKLDGKRRDELKDDRYFVGMAQSYLKLTNPNKPLYIALPKMYSDLLGGLADLDHKDIKRASGAIGIQRSQLKGFVTKELKPVEIQSSKYADELAQEQEASTIAERYYNEKKEAEKYLNPDEEVEGYDDHLDRVFREPGEKVITENRAKDAPIKTQEEADQQILAWEATAKNNANAENNTKVVISLFDRSGEWSRPWRNAGYDVYQIDIEAIQGYQKDISEIDMEWIENLVPDSTRVHAIIAACPCTDFASSGARWWQRKDEDGATQKSIDLVQTTASIIEYLDPKVWAVENPVGRIEKLTPLPSPRMTFNPNHFGNPHTKKTMLYGNFNPELPLNVVEATEGSKVHKLSSSQKQERELTPDGFAYAFFMANGDIKAGTEVKPTSTSIRPDSQPVTLDHGTFLETTKNEFLEDEFRLFLKNHDVAPHERDTLLASAVTIFGMKKGGLVKEKVSRAKSALAFYVEIGQLDKEDLLGKSAKELKALVLQLKAIVPNIKASGSKPRLTNTLLEWVHKVNNATINKQEFDHTKKQMQTGQAMYDAKGLIDKGFTTFFTPYDVSIAYLLDEKLVAPKYRANPSLYTRTAEFVDDDAVFMDIVKRLFDKHGSLEVITNKPSDVVNDYMQHQLLAAPKVLIKSIKAELAKDGLLHNNPDFAPENLTGKNLTEYQAYKAQEIVNRHDKVIVKGLLAGYEVKDTKTQKSLFLAVDKGFTGDKAQLGDLTKLPLAQIKDKYADMIGPFPTKYDQVGGTKLYSSRYIKVTAEAETFDTLIIHNQEGAYAIELPATITGRDSNAGANRVRFRSYAERSTIETIKKDGYKQVPLTQAMIDEAGKGANKVTISDKFITTQLDNKADPAVQLYDIYVENGQQNTYQLLPVKHGEKEPMPRDHGKVELLGTVTDEQYQVAKLRGSSTVKILKRNITEVLAEAKKKVITKKPEEKLKDFGDKIGGARKDQEASSEKTTTTTPKKAKNKNTWERDVKVITIPSEIGTESKWPDLAGKFVLQHARGKKNFITPSFRNGVMIDWSEMGKPIAFDTIELAEQAALIFAVNIKHRVHANGYKRGEDGQLIQEKIPGGFRAVAEEYHIVRHVTDRKKVVMKGGFETESEAKTYLNEHAQEIYDRKTSFGEEVLKLATDPTRTGPQWRKPNEEATAQMFSETFGFRGVEFGNWNNQEERLEILNSAYDGLMDLAELLNIPPKALSLNGDLALAFGARGHGLSGARAHYEPAYAVINITKMKGAGSLAHEWLHALDAYLARLSGKSSKEMTAQDKDGNPKFPIDGKTPIKQTMQSHGRLKYKEQGRAELMTAFSTLIDTMFANTTYSEETFVNNQKREEAHVARSLEEVEKRIDGMRKYLATERDNKYYKRHNKSATARELKLFDTLADKILNDPNSRQFSTKPMSELTGRVGHRYYNSNESFDQLAKLYKKLRGKYGFTAERRGPMDVLVQYTHQYQVRLNRLDAIQAEKHDPKSAKSAKVTATEFYMQATEIDQGRASNYWSTRHEMAARAFSAYIEDTLKSKERASDYLSFGSLNAYYVFEGIKPFPAGEERVTINKAFDEFFKVIKTVKSPSGYTIEEDQFIYEVNEGKEGKNPAPSLATPPTSKEIHANPDAVIGSEMQKLLDASGGSLLADGISRKFQANETATVTGMKFNSPDELGILGQIYRNPAFETFRMVMMKGESAIGVVNVSQRLPDQVAVLPSFETNQDYRFYKDQLTIAGADGYYLLHNHPSGKPTPSNADIALTKHMNKVVPGFKGHVVVNNTEFAKIDGNGDVTYAQIKQAGADGRYITFFTADARKPHKSIGDKLTGTNTLANTAKYAEKNGEFLVIGTSQNKIRAMLSIPNDVLYKLQDEITGNPIKANSSMIHWLAQMRRFKRLTGSDDLFMSGVSDVVTVSAGETLNKLIETSAFTDIAFMSGPTLRASRSFRTPTPLPGHKAFVWGVNEDLGAYDVGDYGLYSKAGTKQFGKPLTVSQAKNTLAPVLKRLKGIANVQLVTRDELPIADPNLDTIEGVTLHDRIYIVVDNIHSTERLKQVLAHEVWGHQAVEAHPAFKQVHKLVMASIPKDKGLQAVMEEVLASQPNLSPETLSKEVIAFIAEKGGHQSSAWAKIVAAVRMFLRKLFPGLSMNVKDVEAFITSAKNKELKRQAKIAKMEVGQADPLLVNRTAQSYNTPALEMAELAQDDELAGYLLQELHSELTKPFTSAVQVELARLNPDAVMTREQWLKWIKSIANPNGLRKSGVNAEQVIDAGVFEVLQATTAPNVKFPAQRIGDLIKALSEVSTFELDKERKMFQTRAFNKLNTYFDADGLLLDEDKQPPPRYLEQAFNAQGFTADPIFKLFAQDVNASLFSESASIDNQLLEMLFVSKNDAVQSGLLRMMDLLHKLPEGRQYDVGAYVSVAKASFVTGYWQSHTDPKTHSADDLAHLNQVAEKMGKLFESYFHVMTGHKQAKVLEEEVGIYVGNVSLNENDLYQNMDDIEYKAYAVSVREMLQHTQQLPAPTIQVLSTLPEEEVIAPRVRKRQGPRHHSSSNDNHREEILVMLPKKQDFVIPEVEWTSNFHNMQRMTSHFQMYDNKDTSPVSWLRGVNLPTAVATESMKLPDSTPWQPTGNVFVLEEIQSDAHQTMQDTNLSQRSGYSSYNLKTSDRLRHVIDFYRTFIGDSKDGRDLATAHESNARLEQLNDTYRAIFVVNSYNKVTTQEAVELFDKILEELKVNPLYKALPSAAKVAFVRDLRYGPAFGQKRGDTTYQDSPYSASWPLLAVKALLERVSHDNSIHHIAIPFGNLAAMENKKGELTARFQVSHSVQPGLYNIVVGVGGRGTSTVHDKTIGEISKFLGVHITKEQADKLTFLDEPTTLDAIDFIPKSYSKFTYKKDRNGKQTTNVTKHGIVKFYNERVRKIIEKYLKTQFGVKLNDGQEVNYSYYNETLGENNTVGTIIIDITPEMRDQIANKGQLFSRRVKGSEEVENIRAKNFSKPMEDRTLKDTIGDILGNAKRVTMDAFMFNFVDDFQYIKTLEKKVHGGHLQDARFSAYKSLFASRNIDSVMAGVSHDGVPSIVDGQLTPQAGKKGLLAMFSPLTVNSHGNLLPLWETWASAIRAQRLMDEGKGREKLWSQEDIDVVLKLEDEYLDADGNSLFRQVHNEYQAFNQELLQLAVDAGTITPEAKETMATNDYIPFHRAIDNLTRERLGMSSLKHGDSGIKALWGSEKKIDQPFENIIGNTAAILHGIQQSIGMKRVLELQYGIAMQPGLLGSAQESLRQAQIKDGKPVLQDSPVFERVNLKASAVRLTNQQLAKALMDAGIIASEENPFSDKSLAWAVSEVDKMDQEQADEYRTLFELIPPVGEDIISVLLGGRRQYYRVIDPQLLASITALGPNKYQPLIDVIAQPSKWLRTGVVNNPSFQVANIIRDTASTWMNIDKVNGPGHLIDVLKATAEAQKLAKSPEMLQMMMAGAIGGGYYEITGPGIRKQLLNRQTTDRAYRDTIRATFSKMWHGWQRVGAVSEQSNRLAIRRKYQSLKDKDGNRLYSDAEANYQAQDVLNFQRHGGNHVWKVMLAGIPFLNARTQGEEKSVRAFNEHKAKFLARGAVITGVSMMLLAANWDDDRYLTLPEWQKDTYWPIFFGDTLILIPKPFELGLIFATLPERMMMFATGRDSARQGKKSAARGIGETLALNPIPQAVKPVLESYINRNFFFDKPIVGLATEGKLREAQYTPYTSATAREFANIMPDFAPRVLNSPVHVEHIIRGYFGWIGSTALTYITDPVVMASMGYPARPGRHADDLPVIHRFMPDPIRGSTNIEPQLYDLLNDANKAYKTVNAYVKEGKLDEARATREKYKEVLQARKTLNSFAKSIRMENKKIHQLMNDTKLTADVKRDKIDAIRTRMYERKLQMRPVLKLFN